MSDDLLNDPIDTSEGTHGSLTPDHLPVEPVKPASLRPPVEVEADEESTIIKRSPADNKRDQIRLKRDDSEDLDHEDLRPALFGKDHLRKPKVAEPEPSLDDVDLDAQPTRGQRIHGNSTVPVTINRQNFDVPMGQLRKICTDNGLDIDGIDDKAVIASARTILAARSILENAKTVRGNEPEPVAQEPVAEGPDPFEDLIQEIQFGEAPNAAQKLRAMIQAEAQSISRQTSYATQRETDANTRLQEVSRTVRELETSPDFQEAAKDPFFASMVNTAASLEVEKALVTLYGPHELQAFDTAEKRGRLYHELRSRGVQLPSEQAIATNAYKTVIQRLKPQQVAAPSLDKPAVQVSEDRASRARTASPQPRASSAQVSQASSAPRGTSIVQQMRQARGQITAR